MNLSFASDAGNKDENKSMFAGSGQASYSSGHTKLPGSPTAYNGTNSSQSPGYGPPSPVAAGSNWYTDLFKDELTKVSDSSFVANSPEAAASPSTPNGSSIMSTVSSIVGGEHAHPRLAMPSFSSPSQALPSMPSYSPIAGNSGGKSPSHLEGTNNNTYSTSMNSMHSSGNIASPRNMASNPDTYNPFLATSTVSFDESGGGGGSTNPFGGNEAFINTPMKMQGGTTAQVRDELLADRVRRMCSMLFDCCFHRRRFLQQWADRLYADQEEFAPIVFQSAPAPVMLPEV